MCVCVCVCLCVCVCAGRQACIRAYVRVCAYLSNRALVPPRPTPSRQSSNTPCHDLMDEGRDSRQVHGDHYLVYHVTVSIIVMSAVPYAPLRFFCVQVPPPHDGRMLWITPSTKCLREELRRVPSHWANSWRYVCVGGGGCKRERCIHVWALVCIRACVCVPTCVTVYTCTVYMYALYVCICM